MFLRRLNFLPKRPIFSQQYFSYVLSLKDYVNYDQFKELPEQEIKKIWIQYHREKDNVLSAILTPDQFYKFAQRANRSYVHNFSCIN